MQLVASRTDPTVLLRLPAELLEQVDRAAARAGRSRNSEILVRLTTSLQSDGGGANPPAASAVGQR